MDNIHSVIDAVADGEAVDPAALKEALATTEGRDYLVDVLVLRGFVTGDGMSMRAALPAGPSAPRGTRRAWFSVAAALAFGSLIGGYYAGQQSTRYPTSPTGATVAVSAPQPTRVIKLGDSADWIERAGDN